MTTLRPIGDALRDGNLLGAALGDVATWKRWLTVLKAREGAVLDADEQILFGDIAGGREPPSKRVRELWALIGRGGGKSRMAAAVATHIALLTPHHLAPGEVGYVLVLAQTASQARVVFDFILAFIEQSPLLRREIVSATQGEIELANGVVIAVHPASYRSVRGRTLLACIFDEVAFWRDETSSLPDIETYRAVLPSLIRTGGALIGISTPYRQSGLLYTKYRDAFGQDDPDVLVVRGDSRAFNPTLSEADIVKAMADDPEAGASEWQAVFRVGVSALLSDADIDACVNFDRPAELPPRQHLNYCAFIDPSGGRFDAFTVCIAHKAEDEHVVVDVMRGRAPPFDPADVVSEFAALLKQYRCLSVVGDGYSAEWTVSGFRASGIRYERSPLSKAQLFLEGLPCFTRRLVSLPDHPRLLRELRLLERKPHSGGRDTIDHQRGDHDDYANALFGALRQAAKPVQRAVIGFMDYGQGATLHEVASDGSTGRMIARARHGGNEWVPVEDEAGSGIVIRTYDERGNLKRESRLR